MSTHPTPEPNPSLPMELFFADGLYNLRMQSEQYEVWVKNKERWDLVATFRDFDAASAVFRNRTYRQRLLMAVYENGQLVRQDVLAEVGRTREVQ